MLNINIFCDIIVLVINMANTKWKELNRMQLGRYAEYYAKMEFYLSGKGVKKKSIM